MQDKNRDYDCEYDAKVTRYRDTAKLYFLVMDDIIANQSPLES